MARTKKKTSRSISIEDVAKRQAFITTVSRVINKVGTVKEKTGLRF